MVAIALVSKASSRDALAVCFVVTKQPLQFVLCLPFELCYGSAYVVAIQFKGTQLAVLKREQ